MKEMFGINTKLNDENCDSFGYQTRTIDSETTQILMNASDQRDALDIATSSSTFFKFKRELCEFIAIVALFSGIYNTYHFNVKMILAFTIMILSYCARLKIIKDENKRISQVIEEAESTYDFAKIEAASKRGKIQLGIPEDIPDIDVFVYRYKESKGKNVIQATGIASYMLASAFPFYEDGKLILAFNDSRYDILLEDIISIDVVKKKQCIMLSDWCKETMFNEGEFKQYKMWIDKLGRLWMRQHCEMHFLLKGEEFVFRFPIYEKAVIDQILNHK